MSKQATKKEEVKKENVDEKAEEKQKKLAVTENDLRKKYQDKLIKDTHKDKRMGSLFWFLLAGCIGMIAFIIITIAVRNA